MPNIITLIEIQLYIYANAGSFGVHVMILIYDYSAFFNKRTLYVINVDIKTIICLTGE